MWAPTVEQNRKWVSRSQSSGCVQRRSWWSNPSWCFVVWFLGFIAILFPWKSIYVNVQVVIGRWMNIDIPGWWFGTCFFSSIVGMMIQSDFHIFKRDWNHQPVFHVISCWLPWNIKMNQPRFFDVGIAPTRQRLESLRSVDTHAMHSLVLMLNMWFKWWVL